MIALLVGTLLAAAPADAPPVPGRVLSVNAGLVWHGAAAGDLLLPVELELPLYKRLRWTIELTPAVGLGVARGLVSFSAHGGLRVFPFGDDARGLLLSLAAGPDLVGTVGEQPFFAVRFSASASLGWAFAIGPYVRVTPALELHPVGLGFPTPGLFFLSLAVGGVLPG